MCNLISVIVLISTVSTTLLTPSKLLPLLIAGRHSKTPFYPSSHKICRVREAAELLLHSASEDCSRVSMCIKEEVEPKNTDQIARASRRA